MPTKTESGTLGGAFCTWPAALVCYAVAGFLTFGHVFNQNYVEPTPVVDCGDVPKVLDDNWDAYWNCRKGNIDDIGSGTSYFDAGFPAAYAAVLWPLYWGAHLGIKVTK